MKKKKYDTAVVMLYLIGREELLPPEFRKQIPYSTISSWRKTDYTTYLGQEFRFLFEDHYDVLALKNGHRHSRRLLWGLARTWTLLRSELYQVVHNARTDAVVQRKVVMAVDYLKSSLGLKTTLRLFGLTAKLYGEWLLATRGFCKDSHSFLCVKRYPHQLQKTEVQRIQQALTAPRWGHWPIVSIASRKLRSGSIIASLYSWYKYARILELSHKGVKKQKPRVGLVATKANEYLHVDTTYYLLSGDRKVCITFVMDNYSKMILGFALGEKLSFEVVKEALSHALRVIARHPGRKEGTLVADGGPENHNHHIDAFLAQLSGFRLTKVRSLKDIQFSNSPVEAIHRIIKGRYLRNRKFDNLELLREYLKWAVQDYNKVRPHYRHRPRTPWEMYFDRPLSFDVKERIRNAAKKRIRKNKSLPCQACVTNALLRVQKLHEVKQDNNQ